MNGLSRDASALIVGLCDRILLHSIVLHALQVQDQAVQHVVERQCGLVHILGVVQIGLCGVGHVVEGANQVEVHQFPDCRHLGTRGVQFTLRIVRILLSHARSIIEHRVAAVDDIIELTPARVGIAGIDVLLKYIREVNIVVNVGTTGDVVGAEFAPCHHAVDHDLLLHGRIASLDNILNVTFLIPELLEHDDIERFQFQEVGTATQRERGQAEKAQFQYIILYLHNSYVFKSQP